MLKNDILDAKNVKILLRFDQQFERSAFFRLEKHCNVLLREKHGRRWTGDAGLELFFLLRSLLLSQIQLESSSELDQILIELSNLDR